MLYNEISYTVLLSIRIPCLLHRHEDSCSSEYPSMTSYWRSCQGAGSNQCCAKQWHGDHPGANHWIWPLPTVNLIHMLCCKEPVTWTTSEYDVNTINSTLYWVLLMTMEIIFILIYSQRTTEHTFCQGSCIVCLWGKRVLYLLYPSTVCMHAWTFLINLWANQWQVSISLLNVGRHTTRRHRDLHLIHILQRGWMNSSPLDEVWLW